MAQMNTRWYSGKISTTSPNERKQQMPQNEDSQISSKKNNSKDSLRRSSVASSSRIQAGKDKGAIALQQIDCPPVGSLNGKPLDVCQFDLNKAACSKQENQFTQIATTAGEVEFNLTFKGLSALDKQRLNDIRSSAAASDLGYWYPCCFLQTLRQQMQETSNPIVSNRSIEVHYYENETTARVMDAIKSTQAAETEQQQESTATNCKKSGKTTTKKRTISISYKCPKKQPKFNAKLIETSSRREEVAEQDSFASANFDNTMCNLYPELSQATNESSNNETGTTHKNKSTKQSTAKAKKSSLSPKSQEQKLNRNTTPNTNLFKWPSDAELELDLSAISPSNVSTALETISSWTATDVLSALQAFENSALTQFEPPFSPREHEMYLAQIEQLKEQLERSIKQSKEQRLALDTESLSVIRSLSEKGGLNRKSSNSKTRKHANEAADKLADASTTSKHTRQRSKQSTEKAKTQKSTALKADVAKAQAELPPKKIKCSKSNVEQVPGKVPFPERKQLCAQVSKTEPLSPTPTGDLECTRNQSQDSNSSSVSEQNYKQAREHLKNRIKRFVAEAKAANKTLIQATSAPVAVVASSADASAAASCTNNVSAHEREQLVAIANLKERLRRSIREFKKQQRVLDDYEEQKAVNSETKFSAQTVSVQGSGGAGISRKRATTHLFYGDGSFLPTASENEPNEPVKKRGSKRRLQQQLLAEQNAATTSKVDDLKVAKNSEHTGKARKIAAHNQGDNNLVGQTRKVSQNQRQSTADEEEVLMAGDRLTQYSLEETSLKYSKAKTSLHRMGSDKSDKENTRPSSESVELKHEQYPTAVVNNQQPFTENTRSITTQTKTLQVEKATLTSKISKIHTSTIGTQFSSTRNNWYDRTAATDTDEQSNEMDLQTLIHPQTTRSEALSAVLKARYKSLMERARGEFAWLQLKKQRYRQKGLHERIASIRQKQQQILRKMESERNMIQRVLESALKESTAPLQRKPKLSPSYSAPDIGAVLNERHPSITTRLERIEHLLAWNFNLDAKEANVVELEQMLRNCNYRADISPEVSTKTLLYRIRKIEGRVEALTEKVTTLEHSTFQSSSQLIAQVSNEGPSAGGRLNRFWQRMTSQRRGKISATTIRKQQRPQQDTNFTKTAQYNSEIDEMAAFNEFSRFDEPSASASGSSQFIVYQTQRGDTSEANDDGIVVLYSPLQNSMPEFGPKLRTR